MKAQAEKALKAVLALPPGERAEVIERILASFDTPARKRIDAAWAREVERRIGELERGEMKLVPGEKVFSKIRRKFT